MLVVGVSPIIAPSIGSYLVANFGWRYTFGAMTGLGAVVLVAAVGFLKESKGMDRSVSLNPKHIALSYAHMLRHPTFLVYALAGTCSAASFFSYLSGSPFVMIDLLKLNHEQYGLVFGLIALGLILCSQMNRWLLQQWTAGRILKWALFAQSAFGMLLLTLSLLGLLHLYVFIGLALLLVSCCGFTFSNASALAMEPFEKDAGLASALLGALQMGAGALASVLLGLIANNTEYPMLLLISIFALLGYLLILLHDKRSKYVLSTDGLTSQKY